ncbi:hypothetical protein CLF_103546 [Clonorchis sinensis]|uniref:C2H2-type domain-containing protein n=1 Tax=Clonorchis sinensis TaxID=79923 RepID=G7YNI3_CLOSI|nr:hypothetical protein CLF_103546 [Clonorchis sinensis]
MVQAFRVDVITGQVVCLLRLSRIGFVRTRVLCRPVRTTAACRCAEHLIAMNFKKLQSSRPERVVPSSRRPGDILFSTVAGGPAHVHSPQDYCRKLESLGGSASGDGCHPVSLFNSLLDPNIELPTITVREVDAVLSNLSEVASLSTKGQTSDKTNTASGKCEKDTFSTTVFSHHSDSPAPINECNREGLGVTYASTSAFRPFTGDGYTDRMRDVAVDNDSRVIRTGIGTAFVGTQLCEVPLYQDARHVPEKAILTLKPSCSSTTSSGKFADEAADTSASDKPQLGNPDFHSRFREPSNTTAKQISSRGEKSIVSHTDRLHTQGDGKQFIRKAHLPPVGVTLSQTPFGSLDLATDVTLDSAIVTEGLSETDRLREANLSLRIAKQGQLFNTSAKKSPLPRGLTTLLEGRIGETLTLLHHHLLTLYFNLLVVLLLMPPAGRCLYAKMVSLLSASVLQRNVNHDGANAGFDKPNEFFIYLDASLLVVFPIRILFLEKFLNGFSCAVILLACWYNFSSVNRDWRSRLYLVVVCSYWGSRTDTFEWLLRRRWIDLLLPTCKGLKQTCWQCDVVGIKFCDPEGAAVVDRDSATVCPHPRCGRRYQAELTLLRHLSKYHREDVGLPQRSRLRRRPASEERSPAKDGATSLLHQKPNEGLKSASVDEPLAEIARGRADSWNAAAFHNVSIVRANWCSDVLTDTKEDVTTHPKADGPRVGEFNSVDILPSSEHVTFPVSSPSTQHRSLPKGSRRAGTLPGCPSLDRGSLDVEVGSNHGPSGSRGSSTQASDCDCLSMKSQSIWRSSPNFTGDSELFLRQPRLRSVSGSHDAQSTAEDPSVHIHKTDRHEAHNPHTNPVVASPQAMLSQSGCEVWTASSECGLEAGRRRTLSTGAQPRRALSGTQLMSKTDLEQPCQSTCPSCGFGLNTSETKRREWMSGVRALTYSKTDSICCPIDGCAYVCYGRADLSSHLTCSHFPEVQNQLVRLIFACPVKDCHMVCADEKNFQAHFNRHLFGYLPGDLSGLFPPVPVSSVSEHPDAPILKQQSPLPNTDIQCTDVNVCSLPPSVCSPNVRVDPPHTSVLMKRELESTTFPIPDIFPASQNPLTPAEHTLSSLASSHTCTVSPDSERTTLDLTKLHSPPSNAHLRDSIPVNTTDFIEIGVDSDRGMSTVKQQTEVHDQVLAAPTAAGGTDTAAHMDLTDHRNLISALDLIPDDILMELLKEDRPGLWGDGVAPNVAMYSAPHTWDSPTYPQEGLHNLSSPRLKADCVNDFAEDAEQSDASGTAGMCDSVSVVQPFASESAHQPYPDDSRNSSPALNCNSWVPSPVVHQTWSLAVANERPLNSTTSEADYSIHSKCEDYAYDCPRHVLSDLTAALILPDVERRLKASISTDGWTGTSAAPTTTPRSTASESVVDLGFRSGRQAWCSGKRRRNASESSPTGVFRQTAIPSVGNQNLPAKTGKQLTETDITVPNGDSPHSPGQNEVTGDARFMNGHTPFIKNAHAPSHGKNMTSLKNKTVHTKATFYADTEDLPARPDPLVNYVGTWTSEANQTYCLSPKHPGVEPKKRRRKLHKVMTVDSDSHLPVTPFKVRTRCQISSRHLLLKPRFLYLSMYVVSPKHAYKTPLRSFTSSRLGRAQVFHISIFGYLALLTQ